MSPEKITLEDGTEREVLSDEEVKELQAKAEANTKVEEEKADLQKQLDNLNQEVNPNWKQAREKMNKMTEALKAKGIDVDEEGNPVEQKESVSKEELIAEATKTAEATIIKSAKENLLKSYDEETKKVINVYFDKLTAGEKITPENLGKFVSDAIVLSTPEEKRGTPVSYGQPPKFSKDSNATITEQTVAMGKAFGNTAEDLEKGNEVKLS